MKLKNSAVLSFAIAIICGATLTNGFMAEIESVINIYKEIKELIDSFNGQDKTTIVPLENLQTSICDEYDIPFELMEKMVKVDVKLTESTFMIINEIKFQQISDVINEIKSSFKLLSLTINVFNKKPDLMVERLSKIHESHLLKSLEFNLISALDFHLPGSISAVESFTQRAILYESSNDAPVKTSTNQHIISFYEQVIEVVSMGQALLAISYELIENYYNRELLFDELLIVDNILMILS